MEKNKKVGCHKDILALVPAVNCSISDCILFYIIYITCDIHLTSSVKLKVYFGTLIVIFFQKKKRNCTICDSELYRITIYESASKC